MTLLPLQIRFNDIDMMGHINNAVYLEFFDLGKEHFFRNAAMDLYGQDFTIMIVHVDVDFKRQIHFDDHIGVTSTITRYGNKSLDFVQQIVLLDADGAPIADEPPMAICRTVMSGYSRSAAASAVIPDGIKHQLQEFDK